MKVTKKRLQRIIREEAARLHEDHIDTELDNLEKNREDDLEHIRNLRRDIEDDREEERRAHEEERRHDESRRRTVGYIQALIRETLQEAGDGATEMSKAVEKAGTGGDFSKWCGEDGVTQAGIDRAVKAGGKRAKQANMAVNFSKGKGGGKTLTYPKKKD